jgi:AraC family transcriptional regulator
VQSKHFGETKRWKPPGDRPAPLTLPPGQGFESRHCTSHVDDFIVVDAFVQAGVQAPLHRHERGYFTLILNGGFEERFQSQTLAATAGMMNFVPPLEAHRTQSYGARFVRIEVPDSALAVARSIGPMMEQPALFHDPHLVSIARRVLAEVRSGEHGWRLITHGLLLELLGYVVRDQTASEMRGIPRWIGDVKERLDSEWDRSLSLSELAQRHGRHPVHLARAFRAAYGRSVGEYRRAKQLKAAQDRLLGSDEDVLEVALACGFVDQSHFSKAFSRAFGMSPSRYRRVLRQ